MLSRKEVQNLIEPHLYKSKGYTYINFKGTYSDYKVPMIFVGVTASGHIRVKDVTGTKEGGIPSSFRNRVAKQRHRESGYYWWIEDGTGSLIFKVRE